MIEIQIHDDPPKSILEEPEVLPDSLGLLLHFHLTFSFLGAPFSGSRFDAEGSCLQEERDLSVVFEYEGSCRTGLGHLENVERHFGIRLRTCSRWLRLRGGYHH